MNLEKNKKIHFGIPEECHRCGHKFKTFSKICGQFSKEEIKLFEMEFLGKVMLHQKEHRKSCIKNHTQTREVLFEKK